MTQCHKSQIWFTCTKTSLVEKNISSLEHRIRVETDAAFILHFALHLRKRLREEKHETKHELQLRRLLSFPFPPQRAVFTFTTHRFSGKRCADEFTWRFPPCLRPTQLSSKQKGVFCRAAGSRSGTRWLSLAPSRRALKLHVAGKGAVTVGTFEISGRWNRETKQ